MSNVVHFILGSSATASLMQTFPDAKIVGMLDELDAGPCRFEGMQGMSSWLRHRRAWWLDNHEDDWPQFTGSAIDDGPPLEDVIAEVDQVILWIAEGAVEQLYGCWLTQLLPDSIEILHAQPERWENESTMFIGFARSEVLVNAPKRTISQAERQKQKNLWQAFVASSPLSFFDLANRHRDDCLTAGLHALIGHFPHRMTGLTDYEAALLAAVHKNGSRKCMYSIGEVGGRSRGPLGFMETRLVDVLFEFEASGVLCTVEEGKYARDYAFELTCLGLDILQGRTNRVDAIGFDRWFGGTHMSESSMWWREGDRLTSEAP